MDESFWIRLSNQWSHRIDSAELEQDSQLISALGSRFRNIPDKFLNDSYDDYLDDDDD